MLSRAGPGGRYQGPERWRHLPRTRTTTGFTGSTEAIGLAQVWLKTCLLHHSYCGKDEDRPLPTRLLDLRSFGDEEIIKLVHTAGGQGRYAALSHCWGKSPQIITTLDNLLARKRCIPFDELTKTFQEAVLVSRALSIEYLWIDSLCIIQNSADDWAREASMMGAVYQNALVTIAATASDSGTKGLFRKLHQHEVYGCTTEGEDYRLIFREQSSHFQETGRESARDRDEVLFPLTYRAWCLQERLLSPHVLHFTPNELVFECLQNVRCECRRKRKLLDTTPKTYIHSSSTESVPSTNKAAIWRSLVSAYSELRMTYPSDKLVAFSGVAKKFAQPGNDYLAGLWRNSLLDDLLWNKPWGEVYPRPVWRAPSWSWASVDGQISRDLDLSGRIGDRSISKYSSVELIDCNVALKGIDEYGEITSGTLRLRGSCTPVAWSRRDELENSFLQFPSGFECRFDPDFPFPDVEHETSGRELVCLLLLREDEGRDPWRASLVLRNLEPGKNVFERVGFLWLARSRYFHQMMDLWPDEKTVVVIV
jgi:hypothetical protein